MSAENSISLYTFIYTFIYTIKIWMKVSLNETVISNALYYLLPICWKSHRDNEKNSV